VLRLTGLLSRHAWLLAGLLARLLVLALALFALLLFALLLLTLLLLRRFLAVVLVHDRASLHVRDGSRNDCR
jgi:hypothetical protein